MSSSRLDEESETNWARSASQEGNCYARRPLAAVESAGLKAETLRLYAVTGFISNFVFSKILAKASWRISLGSDCVN